MYFKGTLRTLGKPLLVVTGRICAQDGLLKLQKSTIISRILLLVDLPVANLDHWATKFATC